MTVAAFLDIAELLLDLPTAPYHEHHVVAAVLRHLAGRREVTVRADAVGNLRLSTGQPAGGLCLTAHLDHPALGFAWPESARDVLFERLGGVPDEWTRDAAVRIYTTTVVSTAGGTPPDPIARGRVAACLEEGVPGDPQARPAFRVRLDTAADVPPGAFAVWDLPRTRLRGHRLEAPACDDLAGVAVALTVLDRVGAVGGSLSVLLTRAEETGFGGMLAALATGFLDSRGLYVNIEASSSRAGAALGEGPVIRVGDRRWLFDAGITGALDAAAAQLHQQDELQRVQRRLMDGGTCEATALARGGHAAGAVALPLDNYHNRGEGRLRAEAVDRRDAETLVALLTTLALRDDGAAGAVAAATRRLDETLAARRSEQEPRLRRSVIGLPAPLGRQA